MRRALHFGLGGDNLPLRGLVVGDTDAIGGCELDKLASNDCHIPG